MILEAIWCPNWSRNGSLNGFRKELETASKTDLAKSPRGRHKLPDAPKTAKKGGKKRNKKGYSYKSLLGPPRDAFWESIFGRVGVVLVPVSGRFGDVLPDRFWNGFGRLETRCRTDAGRLLDTSIGKVHGASRLLVKKDYFKNAKTVTVVTVLCQNRSEQGYAGKL